MVKLLTEMEAKVMAFAETGMRSSDIAIKINKSKKTVDFHLANIYKKLGARNRCEAVYKYKSE